MSFIDRALDRIGRLIAQRLTSTSGYEPFTPSDPTALRQSLQIADVLLVEANQRVGTAIKYLTRSMWSHAALYVGDLVSIQPVVATHSANFSAGE